MSAVRGQMKNWGCDATSVGVWECEGWDCLSGGFDRARSVAHSNRMGT